MKEEKQREAQRLRMSLSDEQRVEEEDFTQYVAKDQASRLQALYKKMEKEETEREEKKRKVQEEPEREELSEEQAERLLE